MAQFTYDEVIKGIVRGEEGSIQVSFEDAAILAKMLLKYGYAVLFTAGDLADRDVRVEWRYAGDGDDLNAAHREQVAFGDPDFVDMLAAGDYREDDEDAI